MSDTFITSAPETESAGTTVTTDPGQTTGVGNVDPNTGEIAGSSEDGQPKGQTEDGQAQPAPKRKWSLQDEVKELRAQRRELREQLRSTEEIREELRSLRESMSRQGQEKPAKTPANFWQDPEAHLQALRDEIAQQNQGLMEAFHRSREEEYAQQALKQEQSSAVEFIRSQPGYSSEDDEDLIEIIESIPNRKYLSPSWVAEFAWMKLNQAQGVADKSVMKRQASGVQGQPPGTGFGRKVWPRQEFDAAVDMLEKAPNDPKNSELLKELESAMKEGRVK